MIFLNVEDTNSTQEKNSSLKNIVFRSPKIDSNSLEKIKQNSTHFLLLSLVMMRITHLTNLGSYQRKQLKFSMSPMKKKSSIIKLKYLQNQEGSLK
jgi:hypothetical protein